MWSCFLVSIADRLPYSQVATPVTLLSFGRNKIPKCNIILPLQSPCIGNQVMTDQANYHNEH